MNIHDLTRTLNRHNDSRIVLLVADGIGGLPQEPGGPTELEAAATPHLDALAARNVSGLLNPVLPGITPGSGPGHVSVFGYDPLEYQIGRGVLEALGIDFDLGPNDVAIRGNFCTVDSSGIITDRRAGRIPSEASARLVEKLRSIRVEGAEICLEPGLDHRFVMVLRGEGFGGDVEDTDPQVADVLPLRPVPRNAASQRTAEVAEQFIAQAAEVLKNEQPANMLLLRGFARRPSMPTMQEVYGLKPAAIAVYPMYRGLARLVGMDILPKVADIEEQVHRLGEYWDRYDFFFVHFKYTDSAGEDGDFEEKVRRIEELDAHIPAIEALKPDVLIVTGDHSTPAKMSQHSWHPVPVVLAASTCRPDEATRFGESQCLRGGLGQIEARYLLPLALAHAGRLQKFGA
ncbi:MAG: 2,3-bisphosphoglycerate-independent phosphoglycerate mutase [Phycisphaerae bacterium]|nr:2,3-bisphosphoglycerate-independent phosphoglycerate mutase [Phycisphaerae bacterium]